jgi:hypothetical protein
MKTRPLFKALGSIAAVLLMTGLSCFLLVAVLFGALGEPPSGRAREFIYLIPAFAVYLSAPVSVIAFFFAYGSLLLGVWRQAVIAAAIGTAVCLAALLVDVLCFAAGAALVRH